MPANDVTITANFEMIPENPEQFTLTIVAGAGGTITDGDNGQYEHGQRVNIAAMPNDDYYFSGWISTGGTFDNASNAATTFTMPGSDVTITATFKLAPVIPDKFTLTITARQGGTIVTGASGQYEQWQRISITARANSGYMFAGWTTSGGGKFSSANSRSTIFTMPAGNVTIVADFELVPENPDTFMLIIDGFPKNGTITEGRNGYYRQGEEVTLVATPDEGYAFSHWESMAGSEYIAGSTGGSPGDFKEASSPETTFTMPANMATIKAYFVLSYGGGDGSQADPFQIANGSHLALLAERVNSGESYSDMYFVLTNDIELSSHRWTPIGNTFTPAGRQTMVYYKSQESGLCDIEGHSYLRTINVTCWSGGWDTNVCSRCGAVEVGANGQPITYGWRGALGHDYKTIEITEPTCWVGGGEYVECMRCGYKIIINWKDSLGHAFGSPQPSGNPLWNIVYCERKDCGYSEYRVAKR